MSIPREIVRDYMEASQNILKLEDLTEAEIEVVQEMLDRLREMLASVGNIEP